eukprot:CAMPEP_0116902974 /NCGR_PEP_ID=MMETSP0467-20121206/10428_1 /TAXON_ID=283647 /ORGANISM="Mesodinium pulex, Strain SPMC105" /LENGTH=107 /DNA_ID=CAMNT_0004577101 /DNA_START=94 /DNA_END=417 /DNA_ORIENTATION=-
MFFITFMPELQERKKVKNGEITTNLFNFNVLKTTKYIDIASQTDPVEGDKYKLNVNMDNNVGFDQDNNVSMNTNKNLKSNSRIHQTTRDNNSRQEIKVNPEDTNSID